MRCSDAQEMFDDYLDGETPSGTSWDMQRHVLGCTSCQHELEQRRVVRECLSRLPVRGPSDGFFDRVFEQIDERSAELTALDSGRRRGDRFPGWPKGRRMAMAAVVAIVCALAFVMQQPFSGTPPSGIPEVTIAMHEVTPVRLVFSADTALQDARLSLKLPANIELAGYSGRSTLSWTTNLEPGKNVLRLPLVGHVAAADEVVATLEHARGSRTFRLKVKVI